MNMDKIKKEFVGNVFSNSTYMNFFQMTKNRPIKKYMVIERADREKGFVDYKCPSCNQEFGLDARFLENSSELNFQYGCPYCHKKFSIRNP